jgi:DNA polymerase-3 subunit delta
MQIRTDQLAAALKRAPQQRMVVLHGDEPLLHQEAADAVRAWARQAGFTERQVHTVSGAHFDWSSLLGAASEMSLFAAQQLIEIRLPSGKPGKDGSEALQRYARFARERSDDLFTLVLLPRLDRTQLSSAWMTALDEVALCVRIDPIERRALPAWLAQRLAVQGQRVEDAEAGQQALAFFADRVEGNLLAAHQEISKLGLLHPPGVLSLAQISQAVLNVARYDVFKLSEAVLGGQVGRALRMLEGLEAEGEAAVLVHWALADDLRMLLRVHTAVAAGQPLAMVLREARVWGVKEKQVERLMPRLKGPVLVELIQAARICDGLVKGIVHPAWPREPWQALRRLMLMTMEGLSVAPTMVLKTL